MDEPTFPQLAIATRRQTAQLSSETYNTERRLVFEAILRLTYDLARHAAPLPSQSWVARITGLKKADACQAEKKLREFGMLRVRNGPDRTRLYDPEPDATRWGGKGFRWRIEDPLARARALDLEQRAATTRGPDAPDQRKLPLHFVPTPREEFSDALTETRREAARDAAGALPATSTVTIHSPTGAEPVPAGGTSPFIEALPVSLRRTYNAYKARLGARGTVSHPANVPAAAPSSAPAAQLSQGRTPLARQLTPPGSNPPQKRDADPTPAGSSLAGQLTTGGKEGPPVPAGAGSVSQVANDALARQLTPPSHAGTGARMSGTLHSNIEREIYLSSDIAAETPQIASGEMQNAAGAAITKNVVPRAPDELLRMVFRVVRADEPGIFTFWRRQLGPKRHQEIALDILSEIEVRRQRRRNNIGEAIKNEGGWFVSEFYRLTGLPRPTRNRTTRQT